MRRDDLPDAPWIADAETNGVGYDAKPIWCPICNAEDPDWFYFSRSTAGTNRELLGCSECVDRVDPEEAEGLLPQYDGWRDE